VLKIRKVVIILMKKLINKKMLNVFLLTILKIENPNKKRVSNIVGIRLSSPTKFRILLGSFHSEYLMKNNIRLMQKILAMKKSISIFF